jgi:hypothetical protein
MSILAEALMHIYTTLGLCRYLELLLGGKCGSRHFPFSTLGIDRLLPANRVSLSEAAAWISASSLGSEQPVVTCLFNWPADLVPLTLINNEMSQGLLWHMPDSQVFVVRLIVLSEL